MILSTNLLLTKLQPPPLRVRRINRTHLLDFLEENRHRGCSVTLLSAPAGYGKSTLLAEWVQHSCCRTAWFLLDEADNDPVRFMNYLLAAVHCAVPQTLQNKLAQFPLVQPSNLEQNA